MSKTKKAWLAGMLIIVLLAIDQAIKVYVKLHMTLGQRVRVLDWFYIDFIENNGMAWGMQLGSKLFLSIFRIVVALWLIWYIVRQIKKGARTGFIVVLSMICAGAAGNIFDSIFFGRLFTESTPFSVAQLVHWGSGYAPVFMGRVVDMFYFPLIDTYLPDWMPLVGGYHLTFFDPKFNFADACITTGIFALLLFYRKDLNQTADKRHIKAEEAMK